MLDSVASSVVSVALTLAAAALTTYASAAMRFYGKKFFLSI